MSDSSNNPQPTPQDPPAPQSNSLTSPRSLRQLSLFLAGATFFTLSSLITRRSLARRQKSVFPSFYHPSNRPPQTPINGAFEAFEALNLATINVTSFMMMVVGGMGWALDISGLEDLRRLVRGGLGVDGTGRGESEVEEEWEEWLAGVLKRKEEKEKRRREGGLEGKVRRARDEEREREELEEEFAVVGRQVTNERGKPR
ncbi:hypothetical protein JMJ35_007429 [Cladonia borealis]|uniref:Altered inheritance of mitochondria protein 11 n=1 Tax=Cladonia borealis TaxID=184061 RepID=A0AA39QXS9_9LECA|nr:hypothetical protein JMJ35_007429 [Cladonia borealis]